MSVLADRAARHARLRWIGAPLLVTGIGLAGWAIYLSLGGGSWWNVGLGMLGAGLSLATFGANHDTAMALAFRARDEGLAEKLRAELETELARDRDEIIDLKASPKVGMVMPVVALALQAWVCTRLLELVA
jgi:hypothetical protein